MVISLSDWDPTTWPEADETLTVEDPKVGQVKLMRLLRISFFGIPQPRHGDHSCRGDSACKKEAEIQTLMVSLALVRRCPH